MDPTYFQPKNKTIRRLLVSSTDSKLFHENEWSIGVNWNSFFLVQFDIEIYKSPVMIHVICLNSISLIKELF